MLLVVDDDAPIRRMLERTLSAEGYAVRAVADGGSALAAVEQEPPELIVLDVGLPGLDGLAVCRRVRERGLALPILLLTARDAVGDRVTGLDAGADDYLVKPFAAEELSARVRALLRRGRAPARVLTRRRRRARPRLPPGPPGLRASSASPRGRPTCSSCSCATPGRSSPASWPSTGCGGTRAPPPRTSSTATSPTSAESSATRR